MNYESISIYLVFIIVGLTIGIYVSLKVMSDYVTLLGVYHVKETETFRIRYMNILECNFF